jgi:type IV pilus assembly protein PilC
MGRFTYVARTSEGTEVKGTLHAPSISGARAALIDRNLSVEQVEARKSVLRRHVGRGKVPRPELMHFSRQLAAFVRAGVPLLESIEVIGEEASNPKMRQTMATIAEGLRAGDTFSDALAAHPKVFPNYYLAAVRSAELTGRLDSVLDQVGRYLERDLDARRKLKSALTYPALIVVMSIGAILVLTMFVLPRFQTFFESLGGKLPATTRMLLAITQFVSGWWWAILVVFAGLIAGSIAMFRTERGRALRDRIVLRLPVVGKVVRYAIVERACSMLSSMVRAGVSLPEAMVAAGGGTGNAVYQRALAKAREEMMHGDGFAHPIARTGLFPTSVVQMIRVGEDTGTLDDQLDSAARFYELELDFAIKRLTTLFEPAIILTLGVMVAFVALAMVQAMYGILSQAGSLQ